MKARLFILHQLITALALKDEGSAAGSVGFYNEVGLVGQVCQFLTKLDDRAAMRNHSST
jgi:hypothetical protein